jgi:hypothetical protein
VKKIYDFYASNKLGNSEIFHSDLFINLIKDHRSSIIGRIFEQKIEE